MADWLTNGDSTTRSITVAAALLRHYSFDMAGQAISEVIPNWTQDYPSGWLRAAVIESLYQGRYKAISVQQILTIWQRRSRPLCHFNGEFERIVCSPILEGYTLDSVVEELEAEELRAIADPEKLTHGRQSASLSSEAGQGHFNHSLSPSTPSSASDMSADAQGSIPPLRPFSHIPQSALSGDRPKTVHKRSIHQFVPQPDSAFCQRLQAMSAPHQAEADELADDLIPDHGRDHERDHRNPAMPAPANLSASAEPPIAAAPRLDAWVEEANSSPPDATLDADLRSLTNAGSEMWD